MSVSEEQAPSAQGESESKSPSEQDLTWKTGPNDPREMGAAAEPRVVLLHAEWCQWCRVLEEEVLPAGRIVEILSARYEVAQVDVDEAPGWMDLPGVDGLPSLVFFDPDGGHVLTKSGYRSVSELQVLLEAIADKIASGELEPYEMKVPRRLAESEMTPEAARAELERLEKKIYFAVNSNDGGFSTPSRHPHPALLVELRRWRAAGGPERVSAWVSKTVESALRGTSPRLRGQPRAGMDYDADELRRLSRRGAEVGPRWRHAIEALPNLDPYLGIQDQVDHGVFRYAAGPGWYHPHFERMAADNLAWVALLAELDREEQAARVESFVEATFADEGLLRTSQVSDPFYYRLRAEEREGLAAPAVPKLYVLGVQARAAALDSAYCDNLLRLEGTRWPHQLWTRSGEDEASSKATPDAVGQLLIALARCDGDPFDERRAALVDVVKARWTGEGLEDTPRLHRLAAGLCAASPPDCARALASVEGLDPDLSYPPPLVALHQLAHANNR